MASEEHLTILKQGVEVWNKWREDNPETQPDLSGANLIKAYLSGADLSNANLSGAYFTKANLSRADLSRANLSNAYLSGANLINAYFSGAYFSNADLSGANLINANLSGANLSNADLSNAKLGEADLFRANLSKAKLGEADLSKAYLSEAYLSKAYLSKADFYKADLGNADLSEADLSNAKLGEADLYEANLSNVNLSGADLGEANLNEAVLIGANLSGADLTRAILVETKLEGANLTNCRIYGISVWNLEGNPKEQSNLIITRDDEPTITVDDLEVAQFVYMLLNHKKLRNVINAVTQKGVLILGRFGGGGLEVLQSIADKLREMKYLPIIFDFDRPDNRDYTETIKTLAGLSRFVIVDLSGPSVPQELYATVPHFKIPFVPIIEEGRKTYSMFRDFLEYPWVLKLVEFANKEQLIEWMPSKIIAPAEERHKERQAKLDEIF